MEINVDVYGIELMPLDKIIYFSNLDTSEEIKKGQYVLVESEMGKDTGRVVTDKKTMTFEQLGYEPTPILKILTEEDQKNRIALIKEAKDVSSFTKIKSKEMNLSMRVLKAKYTFDKSKLIIYFGADTRVDFRELVKELAKKYKVRIELRQVGIRDEVKMCGSLGLCGQPACCSRFLREFDSIKMELAKTQQMMINTAKISGRCGKLLCCLRYENEFYEEILKNVPYENTTIEYEGKPGKVITVNVFLKEVTVQVIEDNQPILHKVPFEYFKNQKSESKLDSDSKEEKGKN